MEVLLDSSVLWSSVSVMAGTMLLFANWLREAKVTNSVRAVVRKVTFARNVSYMLVNVLWVAAILWNMRGSWSVDFCRPAPSWLFVPYYFSRFWEFFDVITYGLVTGVAFHPHLHIHHLTTPILCFVLLQYPRENGMHFMLANVCMHVMLCCHFAGLVAAPWFGKLRLFWGHFQLLLGVAECAYAILSCQGSDPHLLLSQGVPLAFYLLYFLLFQMEIWMD